MNAPEARSRRGSNASARGSSPAAVRERERQRSAGEPEAPPTPGERDLSKPQITLPDGVRKLLDDLRGPKPAPVPQTPSAPDGQSVPDSGLLDYLLAP